MKIDNHFLFDDAGTQVPFRESPNIGGALAARFLVMHFTAGASADSSIRHLCNPAAKASAHLVIGRDGAIVQLVPFDRVAWHAGVSRWGDIRGLNGHSIGIELDNAGALTGAPGAWKTWFGRACSDDDCVVAAHRNGGATCGWHAYPEAQISAALAASEAIFAAYRLEDLLGHDDIAPGRKTDPGPAFPMDHFRSRLAGRADDAFPLTETTANVNVREGPGTQFAKLDLSPAPKGTLFEPDGRDGVWLSGEVLDAQGAPAASGWIHGNYLTVTTRRPGA